MRPLPLLVLLASSAACSQGSGGATGPAGPVGPTGPGAGPVLDSLEPPIASSASTLELLGSGFSSVIAADQVLVDGVALDILSASGGRLVASGLALPAVLPEASVVSVQIGGVDSNALPLTLAAAGTSRPLAGGGLVDPQTLAPDQAGTGLLVFDAADGVLHESAGTLSPLFPASLFSSPRVGAYGPGGLWVADADRIVVVGSGGTVTAKVTGLLSPASAVSFDGSGNLYWVDGGNSIRRYGADGSFEPTFASVPTGGGITFLSGSLYVTDPGAGTISQVSLAGVVSPYATGLPGVRGITNDGTSLYACVPDSSGSGAVKVVGGVAAAFGTAHPLPGPASSGCLFSAGGLWTVSTVDGALERTAGGAWSQEAGELGLEASGAAYAGERLFLALGDRCAAGQGALVEALAGDTSRLALSGVCAVGAMAPVGGQGGSPAALLVADRHAGGAGLLRLDLGSEAVTTLVSSGGLGGAPTAVAAAGDGTFFVALNKGASFPVAHYSADGQTLLAADVTAGSLGVPCTGLAVSGGALLVAVPDRIHSVPVAGGGAISTLVSPAMGFTSISRLVPAPAGALFYEGANGFLVDSGGSVRWLQLLGGATDVGWTFWNDLLVARPNAYPSARLQ